MADKNENVELLNYVYQNAQMGASVIKQLLDIAKDKEFCRLLKAQYNDYNALCDDAKRQLNDHGYDEKGIGAMQKMSSHLMINMKTLTDKSPEHIAEMMITGSNMGVIDAIKKIKQCPNAKPGIKGLMEKLRAIEENNLAALKNYLSHSKGV
jgi:hypothetical protein